MDKTLIAKSRDALGRIETSFSKVQSIGRIGSERCSELISKIKSFSQEITLMREEVGAAQALVVSNDSRNEVNTRMNKIILSSVNEAVNLENEAIQHLNNAHEANRNFQKLKKSVELQTTQVWEDLQSVAKIVAEADKYLIRGEEEFRNGDERKSTKCMDKAIHKAKKATHEADKTELILENIMNMLREGRSSLHLAERNLSNGEVKLSQARSLAFSVLDTLGIHNQNITKKPSSTTLLSSSSSSSSLSSSTTTTTSSASSSTSSSSSKGGGHRKHKDRHHRHSKDRPSSCNNPLLEAKALHLLNTNSESDNNSDIDQTHQYETTTTPLAARSVKEELMGHDVGGGGGGGEEEERFLNKDTFQLNFKHMNDISRQKTNIMKPAAMGPPPSSSASSASSSQRSSSNLNDNDHLSHDALREATQTQNHNDDDDSSESFNLSKEEEMLLILRDTWLKDEALLVEISRQRHTIEESIRGNEAELLNLGKGGGGLMAQSSQSSGGSSGSSGWKEGRKRDKIESRSSALKSMLDSLRLREVETRKKVEEHMDTHRTRFLNRPKNDKVNPSNMLTRPHTTSKNNTTTASETMSQSSSQSQSSTSSLKYNQHHPHSSKNNNYEFSVSEKVKLAAYYFALATDFEDRNMLDDAVNAYEYSLLNSSEQPECHYNLAIVLDMLGRFDQSVIASRAAIKLRPDWAEAHYNLGQTFDSIGDLNNAVTCYEKACLHNPGWEDAEHNLAAAKHELQLSKPTITTPDSTMTCPPSTFEPELGEGEEWDVESATSHGTNDSSQSGSSSVSFWSAHSHLSKASGKLSQSSEHSHTPSSSSSSSNIHRHTLETLEATPPRLNRSHHDDRSSDDEEDDHYGKGQGQRQGQSIMGGFSKGKTVIDNSTTIRKRFDIPKTTTIQTSQYQSQYSNNSGGGDGYAASVSTVDSLNDSSSSDDMKYMTKGKSHTSKKHLENNNYSSSSASSSTGGGITNQRQQNPRRQYPEFNTMNEGEGNKNRHTNEETEEGGEKKCTVM